MSTIRAYLAVAGLTDVGFRFYTQNTAAGARVTAGIVDEGDGWYSAAGVTLAGDHVRWDSTGTAAAVAREDLALRLAIAAIYARTDVATSTRSSHSAEQVADAVFDEAAADHNATGSMGAKLNAAGAASDPLANTPDDYAAGTVGALIRKLDVGAPDDTVVVVPGAPADASLCRVFGYFEDLKNRTPGDGVAVTFTNTEKGPLKSERLIVRRIAIAKIVDGVLTDPDADPSTAYVDVQRNDLLTPNTSKYLVTCPELGLKKKEITLATDLFDLASIIE